MAAWRAGATAVASSAEITIALTPCVVAVWMKGTCWVASAALGPTWVTVPPRSLAAFWAPLKATSKYGLLICFGMTTTCRWRAADAAADGGRSRWTGPRPTEASGRERRPDGATEGAGVADEPQAATTRASAAMPAASRWVR